LDLSEPATVTVFLVPPYLRGRAYLMLRDGKAARAEFQKLIDHYGLIGNFPWGALSRLGVARADAMSGDEAEARSAYRHFLGIWADADPDIAIFRQAKAEYARLPLSTSECIVQRIPPRRPRANHGISIPKTRISKFSRDISPFTWASSFERARLLISRPAISISCFG
jgi:hypothetical protein